jgi:hypothetical protein
MRVPSRETLGLRPAKSANLGFGALPSSATAMSVGPRKNRIDALSALQNTPPGTPSVVTCAGFAEPSAGTT